MILKTNENYKFGQKNVLPFVGEVQIDEQGNVEIADEFVNDIVDLNIGFFIPSNVPIEGVETTTSTTLEETTTSTTIVSTDTTTEIQTVDSNSDSVTKETLLNSLDKMSVTELQNLATPFPKSEWRNLKKEELRNYLKSKLQ